MDSLQPDWIEFLSALKRHGVRFLLVGGHALAAHGRPRFTQDLDLLVDASAANARRLGTALVEFGFGEIGRDWRWFTKPYRIQMLGRLPHRIDILTSISGVSFRTAWNNRVSIDTTAGPVAVLGLAELRANKTAAGRTKDQLDIALLDELELATRSPKRIARKPRKTSRRSGK